MSTFGQPESYSDILKRVLNFSVGFGILCSLLLASASPELDKLFNSFSTKVEIGPIEALPILFVLIPLVIGIISRILKLHDRISDVLRIRYQFDTRCVLFPLASGAGVILSKPLKQKIREQRRDLMYSVFYPYASFIDPIIDTQLVRTAADNWGWFWVLLEVSFLLIVTVVILAIMDRWDYVWWCAIALVVLLLLLFSQWAFCWKSGKYQIKASLEEPVRKQTIAKILKSL